MLRAILILDLFIKKFKIGSNIGNKILSELPYSLFNFEIYPKIDDIVIRAWLHFFFLNSELYKRLNNGNSIAQSSAYYEKTMK